MKKKGITYLLISIILANNVVSVDASMLERISNDQSAVEDIEILEEQNAKEEITQDEFSDGCENIEKENTEELEIFSDQEVLIEQDEKKEEEFSTPEEPEISDGNSENAESYFVVDSDTSEIYGKSDWGYTLDSWLAASGTRYSMDYLCNDVNFPNTAIVSLNDSNFGIKIAEFDSNLIYRGLDGWKELFTQSGTREEARKVLVALLENQSKKIQDLGDSEAALECAELFVHAMEDSNYLAAVEFGLTDFQIDLLKKLCTTDKIYKLFLNEEYESVSEYLVEAKNISKNSDIYKFVESFEKSSRLAKQFSKLIKGFKATVITAKTINRIYEIERLKKADDLYCEMLLYIKDHSDYEPIKKAAQDLYNVIYNGSADVIYGIRDIENAMEGYVVDEGLDGVIENIPYMNLIYKSYKYSVDISNILFNVSDMETQRENMRCIAYIGHTVALWLKYNLEVYESAVEDGDDYVYYAKRTLYAYDMLVKTRIAGEKSLQKMMEICNSDKSQNYMISQEVVVSLESTQEYLQNTGVLKAFYDVVTITGKVDVKIYNISGQLSGVVYDGKESEGYIGDIYYKVSYNPLSGTYVKFIKVPAGGKYQFQCESKETGNVDYYQSSPIKGGTSVERMLNNITLEKGNMLQISDVPENVKCIIFKNGEKIQEYIPGTTNSKVLVSGNCGATSSDNLKWTAYDNDGDWTADTLVISGIGKMKDYDESLGNYAPWSDLNTSNSCTLVLENGITHIGEAAFSKCKFTNTLKIPDTVVSVGKDAFYECSGFIGSLTIPPNVTSIGSCAFYGCSGFTGSLIIPDNVTDIDAYAFAHCYGFTGSITISKKMTKILTCTFAQCKGISGKQVIPENIMYVGDGAFFDTALSEYWINNANCYLGDGCVESYDDEYNIVIAKKIIYGYENSTAQAYATQYNHEFRLIPVETLANNLIPLKGHITYTQYDFTGDGNADSFKCVTGGQRENLNLYLSGKYKQTIFIGKGANIYWCKTDTKNPYLLVESRLYGGHELKIYKYSGGKFREIKGSAYLNKVFAFSEFSKLEGNILYVTSTPGTRNTQSFKGILDGIYVETKFKLQGNKVTCVTWNSKVTGRKTFYAQNSFKTSKNKSKLNIKDGPRIKKGQQVALDYVKFSGGTYIYRITVKGKTGWFKDSSSIKFN